MAMTAVSRHVQHGGSYCTQASSIWTNCFDSKQALVLYGAWFPVSIPGHISQLLTFSNFLPGNSVSIQNSLKLISVAYNQEDNYLTITSGSFLCKAIGAQENGHFSKTNIREHQKAYGKLHIMKKRSIAFLKKMAPNWRYLLILCFCDLFEVLLQAWKGDKLKQIN